MNTDKIKKVLIALDYDPSSKKVAEDGYELAKTMGAEVILMHVTMNSYLYTTVYPHMGNWQSDSLNSLDFKNTGSRNFLLKAKRHLGDGSISIIQKNGGTAQMILNTANEMKADCIVMGSHSQKCAADILMGSVTEEVLRKTIIPLFVVPIKKKD